MNTPTIRLIRDTDYAGALAVYAPYVLDTVITFEYEVPTLDEFTRRLSAIAKHYPVLVCEVDGDIVAYSYGSTHRVKTAYQWSVESTIYIAEAYHHKGLASILYTCLFDILRLQGFINVYAGISVPDGKSDKFHPKFGFKYLGVFPKIGYKHGSWHDLKWYEYILSEHIYNPPNPIPISEIQDSEAVREILEKANNELKITFQ
jgi:phosphinothricin acetyltransferase